jgi:RNA polymerase sigma factor (sigma-70 family)
MDPDELVRALILGDSAAGAFLVSHYAPQLLGYAALLAGDLSETDRETLCETTVERAVEKIDRFDRSKGSFPGWLRGILRFEVKDWRRHHPIQVAFEEGSMPVEVPSETSPLRPGEAEPAVSAAQLLDELAPTDRLIIQLRDIEGLPYAAIADLLKVKDEACRQRHKRAMERLKSLGRQTAQTATNVEGGEEQ